jgi:hypothetical protein
MNMIDEVILKMKNKMNQEFGENEELQYSTNLKNYELKFLMFRVMIIEVKPFLDNPM